MNYELLKKLKNVNGVIRVGNEDVIDFKELYDMYDLYITIIRVCTPIKYNLFVYYLLETLKYQVIDKKIVISIQDLDRSNINNLLDKVHSKGANYLWGRLVDYVNELDKNTSKILEED
ncbi:hypothetical protein [Streptobacillus moniliformis]|uniref:hypothetical protein n=1 Tax=Streptobacillus moniliformis TaxID=34105 RepID=UPI0007E3C4EA|nr:hypothetical protein [Streptobacillus moniliformis]